MNWAEIKKAVNSTLGTDKFAPLDKLFLDQKKLVASDQPYYSVVAGEIRQALPEDNNGITTYADLPYQIKMINSGSIRVNCDLRYYSHFYGGNRIVVLVNEIERATLFRSADDGHPNAQLFPATPQDVSFLAGSIISFKIGGSPGSTAEVGRLRICANVIDSSLMDVIS